MTEPVRRTFTLTRLLITVTVLAVCLAVATNLATVQPTLSAMIFLLGVMATPLMLLARRRDVHALLWTLMIIVAPVVLLGGMCLLPAILGDATPWVFLLATLVLWLLCILYWTRK